MKLTKHILILMALLLMAVQPASAQHVADVSDDGRVLATIRPSGFATGEFKTKSGRVKRKLQKRVYIDVWSVRLQKQVCSITVLGGAKAIEEVKLSPDGLKMFVLTKNGGTVWDVKTGRELTKTPRGAAVAFSHVTNVFAVAGKKGSAVYDGLNGNQIQRIRFTAREQAREFFFSPDDRYFVLIDRRNALTVFERGKKRPVKKLSGKAAYFNETTTRLTYLKPKGANAEITTYALPSFQRLGKVNASKQVLITAKRNARKEKLGQLEDPDLAKVRPRTYDFVTTSPDGKHVALVNYKGAGKLQVVVMNSVTGKFSHTFDASLTEDFHLKVQWVGPEKLLIHHKPFTSTMLHITDGSTSRLEYTPVKGKPGERARRVHTVDYNLELLLNGRGLTVHNLNEDHTVEGVKLHYLTHDDNGRYIYVTGPKSILGVIDLEGITSTELNVLWLEQNDLVFEESYSGGDEIAPNGYTYTPFNKALPLDSVSPRAAVDVALKAMYSNDSTTSMQVQFVDEQGNFYTGASLDDWKSVWCNLILRGPDGKTTQVTDFEIIEHTRTDTLPIAYAVVMDFSGSMGPDRATVLQNGVRDMAFRKRPQDAVAIVKYDSRIAVEQELTTDSIALIKTLNQYNYHKYKGGTAMLDATNAAIGVLQDADGYADKVVVLMTDGLEGGSFTTMQDVVINANKAGVRIVSVGYGSNVDKYFLKQISLNTNGSFQQIYRSRDLNRVFEDVALRSQTYYEVRFKTPQNGTYTAVLKTCLPRPTQPLVVDFEVTNRDWNHVRPSDLGEIEVPLKTASPDIIQKDTAFQKPDFTNFDHIEIIEPGAVEKRDTSIVEEFTQVELEFEALDFPYFEFEFDQTTIVSYEEEKLLELVAYLNKYPEINLEVNGHTDSVGRADYNIELSQSRAEKVRQLLIDKGISDSRLTAIGFGSTDPIATNKTEKGRLRNRRVDFTIAE